VSVHAPYVNPALHRVRGHNSEPPCTRIIWGHDTYPPTTNHLPTTQPPTLTDPYTFPHKETIAPAINKQTKINKQLQEGSV
jgi:hypothetical protein